MYNKNMKDQEYIVEIYDHRFERVAAIGPFSYATAHKKVAKFKKKGFLATLTEKEFVSKEDS